VRAVLLAAGLGTRLGGQPKAALRHPAGGTLLERSVAALCAAGVAEVSVVLGPYRERLLPRVQACGAWPLLHTLAAPSLIDSQRLALSEHTARPSGAAPDVMLLLADLPLLHAEHLRPVLAAWQARAAGIQALMPVVNGQRGHPVVLSGEAVAGVLAQPVERGVRAWLAAHPQAVQPLALDDAAYITDVDTPEDVARLGLSNS
jgi:CTP:molybdopterin cytidylyltransferase MocA